MKAWLMNGLRIGLSFGLLAYLIHKADWRSILAAISRVEGVLFGAALLMFLAALFLFAVRWRLLLRETNAAIPYPRLVGYYFIGYFFNNFLPTMIGGDVSRIYFAARDTGEKYVVIATVLMERILGILATLTLASLSMIWAYPYFNNPWLIVVTVSLLGLVALVLLNLLNSTLHRFSLKMLQKVTILGIGVKVADLLGKLHAFRHARRAVLLAYGTSLLCQLLLILMNFNLAKALGLDTVTFGYLTFLVPVTFVLGLVPSINGIGIRDAGYEGLLGAIGVSSAEALSLSFLNTLVPMAMSLVGGVLLMVYRRRREGAGIEEFRQTIK